MTLIILYQKNQILVEEELGEEFILSALLVIMKIISVQVEKFRQ